MSFEPKTIAQLRDDAARLRAEWPEGLPERFSASAMGMLIRCPEQYRQRYALGIKTPPRSALLWGRADHEAVGNHFSKQLEDGTGLSEAEVAEQFAVVFDREVEDAGGLLSVPWFGNTSGDLSAARRESGKIKDAGTRLAALYRKELAPHVHPVAVEREILIAHELWPIEVIGYVDVEEEDNLVERKTAARRNSSPNSEWQWQGRIYQLATNKRITWHQSVKNERDPAKQSASILASQEYDGTLVARTALMVAQAMKQVEHLWTTYGPDEMWPGHGVVHPWACSFCGYRDNCPWWAGAMQ